MSDFRNFFVFRTWPGLSSYASNPSKGGMSHDLALKMPFILLGMVNFLAVWEFSEVLCHFINIDRRITKAADGFCDEGTRAHTTTSFLAIKLFLVFFFFTLLQPKRIPEAFHSSTQVFLGATAGDQNGASMSRYFPSFLLQLESQA